MGMGGDREGRGTLKYLVNYFFLVVIIVTVFVNDEITDSS